MSMGLSTVDTDRQVIEASGVANQSGIGAATGRLRPTRCALHQRVPSVGGTPPELGGWSERRYSYPQVARSTAPLAALWRAR
jgi:hypothetical protein